jgi:UDP-glucose 4-epimerase
MNIIKNKTILITGGTGSFGNALTDKLLELKPKKVIIFSRDEKKQSDMRNKYKSDKIYFVIGDVRDKDAVENAMVGVDYVFHAAALKQVPACEFWPMEAVKTNVLGGNNVIQSAIKNRVKKVVVLSTDKAVYPINAYGMSKALMEKIMMVSSTTETKVCGVRYGNVIYSRGSVVPFFVSLIKEGKPLKITNPEMTRFLFSLKDAVNLVLETLVKGRCGQIYIRKTPACTVMTLATAISEIFKTPLKYEIVGERVGEKLHETLIEGYTSENAPRLDVAQTAELLLTIPEIIKERNEHLRIHN